MINCLPAATFFTSDPRADGWTPEREVGFLLCLAETGLVAAACRAVGMGVSGAYALRRRSDGFAFNLGWEAALLLARQRLMDDLLARAIEGEESVSTRVDGTTTRRAQNYRLGIGMLDKLAPIEMGLASQLIAQDFEAFLQVIAAGCVPAAVRNFFSARTSGIEYRELLQTLPLAEKTAETAAAVAANDNAEPEEQELGVWMKKDAAEDDPDWETNFPPPTGFDGEETGKFGGRDYRRELSDEERGVMIDEYYDVPEISPEDMAEAVAIRDARFGFGDDSASEPLQIKSMAGLRMPPRAGAHGK
ncbi:MAG: hypothetical protein RLZZ366_1775 [Pseudomonadota bacterium]|jgi:hypothetical protein